VKRILPNVFNHHVAIAYCLLRLTSYKIFALYKSTVLGIRIDA
jgi:hypothetical protein